MPERKRGKVRGCIETERVSVEKVLVYLCASLQYAYLFDTEKGKSGALDKRSIVSHHLKQAFVSLFFKTEVKISL